jgi:wyosine [tRNA(Phe)-imidazoG37] synthetase (radical SAM superfamily)
MIAFGPIPSRRLGRSLGINNIPPKICSYACIYCQLGKTSQMIVNPQTFYSPEKIFNEVREKVKRSKEKKEAIDYLTFVPDGEPTLDINLGQEIKLVKSLGIKVAVISNGTLLEQRLVRENLKEADLVSLKVDSVDKAIWKKINRPYKQLNLDIILENILEFASAFKGKIITETMLVKDINDGSKHVEKVADFLALLNPEIAYLSIPIRPPAKSWVQAPDEGVINRSFNFLKNGVSQVEYLIGYEGNAFSFTGEVEEDILSITSVHPMREEALKHFLKRAKSDWSIILKLIKEDKLVETEFEGRKFYIRKLNIK